MKGHKFQPTRPLRGATVVRHRLRIIGVISTHAPLAGRDFLLRLFLQKAVAISTHAPLAGRDLMFCHISLSLVNFNPRAPCGARPAPTCSMTSWANFNPRAPCGARHCCMRAACWLLRISTHAPLAGRDLCFGVALEIRFISTHAPLAGRDAAGPAMGIIGNLFQPTRPLRGATAAARGKAATDDHFNPRAPCGARRTKRNTAKSRGRISTHAPLAGRDDRLAVSATRVGRISTHAPLAGRDSKRVQITMHIFAITDKFQMLLHRMPPVRAFCSFLMQENHADFGCEPPK